jgi:DNA-binding transcriptional LysR family regulator
MATLRQFEYLATVVDSGSFTRAADLLHVTQPALSHQIRALERTLGGPLLERLPRSVRLTPLGRAVLPHARAALAHADRVSATASQVAGLDAGDLHLASVYSLALGLLPPVLRAFRQAYPAITIRLREYPHGDELAEATARGDADLAVGPRPQHWAGPVHVLGVEDFVVVGTDLTPTGDEVALEDLADRDWVHYAPENGLSEILDQAAAAAGFRPRAAVRTEQTAAAPLLAAAGLGLALVPANILPADYPGQVRRPAPPIRRELVAYGRQRPDPMAAAFTTHLAQHLRGRAAGPTPMTER